MTAIKILLKICFSCHYQTKAGQPHCKEPTNLSLLANRGSRACLPALRLDLYKWILSSATSFWQLGLAKLRGTSQYGWRSRGRWFPSIKLQETKSSASRPFTLRPKSKGCWIPKSSRSGTPLTQENHYTQPSTQWSRVRSTCSNSHQIAWHWVFFFHTFPHNAKTTHNLFAHLTPILCNCHPKVALLWPTMEDGAKIVTLRVETQIHIS